MYERAEDLLNLAMEMRAKHRGVSLMDIQDWYEVKRKTAERMRDAILRIFPDAEEVWTDERHKRWRIPQGVQDKFVSFSPEEIGQLHAAAEMFRRANRKNDATAVLSLGKKLLGLLPTTKQRSIDVDLDTLISLEGLFLHPGPRPRIDGSIVATLFDAARKYAVISMTYRSRGTGKTSRYVVHPYGCLYGNRNYLIAFNPDPAIKDFRMFSISDIQEIEELDERFIRDEEFSMEGFCERSFGVFQEETFDVVWKFSGSSVEDASSYNFHPTQELHPQRDGTLIVEFHAGGGLEMCWHLFQWGRDVEILEPRWLAETYTGMLRGEPYSRPESAQQWLEIAE